MLSQFSLAKKIGIGISVFLLVALVAALSVLYKSQKSDLELSIHDKSLRVLLALQASHTQAMLHRGDTKDNNPVLNAFNGTLETIQQTEHDMKIWVFMSQKVLDYQKSQNSREIEPAQDKHDLEVTEGLQTLGHFESESLYRLSMPIILGQGFADNPACFSCHEVKMGIHRGELLGGISLAYDASKDIASFNKIYKQMAVSIVLLALLLSASVFLLINRQVSKPIKRISEQMQRLSAADNLVIIPDVNQAASLEEAQILESMHKIFDVSVSNVFNFRNALDEHNIVSIADLAGNITFVNDLFCKISGYSQQQLLGKNHRILNSGEHPAEFFDAMWTSISNGKIWKGDIKNKAKDGSFYWVSSTIMPFLDETGKPYEYVSIRTDITELKENEIKLLQLSHQAQAANEAKSQFLATMSHEIRTPMNGVLGMAQLLAATDLDAEQQEYLETITGSGQSLLNIINDILDFSKLDANKVELESIPFDLERLCQECLILVSGNVQDKPVELILDYPPECPRFFMGDPARVKQILLNLLSNAIKFTEKGLVLCGINCQQLEQSHQLEFLIEDTGIGLKPESIQHLFEEFTQADSSTTRHYGGTGLGLSICKKLINIMKGDIRVESIFGQGTSFFVSLCLAEADAPKIIEPLSLAGVRVLFVDDNSVNRRVFNRQLEYLGMHVDLLADPQQVIETLHLAQKNEQPYELAVLDQSMPILSGSELGKLIRKEQVFDNLKLMIFSSTGVKGDAANFARIGFDAYLSKLSRYEILQSVLTAMLSHVKGDPIITQHSIADSEHRKSAQSKQFEATVLLVDDVKANQVIAKKMLENMGVEVEIANNGEEALEAFQKKQYQLIFMDCKMPVMNGYEASKAIRDIEQQKGKQRTPIVALTANTGVEEKNLCIAAGMDKLLTKPFQSTDLSQCLASFFQNESQLDEDKKVVEAKEHVDFDHSVYEHLKQDMGEDIDEVIAVSLQSLSANINELCGMSPDDNVQDVIRLAHSIKSPAGFIGAKNLAYLSGRLEESLRNKMAVDLNAAFEQIQQALSRFKQAIEKL